MLVDMDTRYVRVLMVSGKSPDNFMVRSTASFCGQVEDRENEAEI